MTDPGPHIAPTRPGLTSPSGASEPARPRLAAPARPADRGALSYGDELLTSYEAPVSPRHALRRRLLAVADAAAISMSYVLAWLVTGAEATASDVAMAAATLPVWIVLVKALGLYDRDGHVVHKSSLDELPRLAGAVTIGSALLWFAAPLLPGTFEVGRLEAIAFWTSGVVCMGSLRTAARWAVRRAAEPERCLVVGSGVVAELAASKIAAHPEYGVKVVGRVDLHPERDAPKVWAGEGGLAGPVGTFESVCRAYEVERVIVAFSDISHEALLDVVRSARRLRMSISVVPRLYEAFGRAVEIDEVEGMTLLGLRGFNLPRSSRIIKRAMDLSGAAAGLLLLLPLLAVIAVLIKLTSRGRVLFVQRRVGRGGRPFRIYKLRTMQEDADRMKQEVAHLNEADDVMFKIADDPRVTRLGRFLRRTSIDEVPQLWNVLKGEMSLVGPRPLIPAESDRALGWHRARLDLAPGVTGIWQVLGRTRIPFAEMVRLDYLYVSEWSLWRDVKLLLHTVPVVIRRRGL